MNTNSTYSRSLQKQFQDNGLDSDIHEFIPNIFYKLNP